jgi:predicted DsbA family dithiol-disulfide isomerase
MMARLERAAREANLPFGSHLHVFNSRLAQEVGKWAEEQGKGDAFHMAVFLAYFQKGENIALPEILLRICKDAGLDPVAAHDIMDRRAYCEAVDRDWQRCREMEIVIAPTFIVNERRRAGVLSYGALDSFLTSAGVARRSSGNNESR